MSLLTFTRMHAKATVSVIEAIGSINRQLERHYPDCTCSVLAAANSGMPSESVTVELEITHDRSHLSTGTPRMQKRMAWLLLM